MMEPIHDDDFNTLDTAGKLNALMRKLNALTLLLNDAQERLQALERDGADDIEPELEA